jgi:FdhD protein
MAFTVYEGKKFSRAGEQKVQDALTVEESLEIALNGKPFTMTMRTPGQDTSFIHGYLYTEDVYTKVGTRLSIEVVKENDLGETKGVNVIIPETDLKDGYRNSRNFISVSSCGICGKTSLDDLEGIISDGVTVSAQRIEHMFGRMGDRQSTFKRSGGSHAAAAFDVSGKLLSAMEDIGRHNAVDKVIGELFLQNQLKEAKVLTVSGRISYEIVMKAFRAKIPVLAAVSAPSTLAVDFAKELGITLLGFCRTDQATVYSHSKRITT